MMATTGFKPKFTITDSITKHLTDIERARGFLEGADIPGRWLQEQSAKAFLLEAHHTTHIEGTALTLDQSDRLLAGEQLEGVGQDDARELLNYRNAFEVVSEYVEGGGPINEALIRGIHKTLVEGVRGGAAAPGEYRRVQNFVVNSSTGERVYTPPPAYEVPIMMGELMAWLDGEKSVHPVLVSGVAQFQLVHIHPFLDGNGRTSRILSTLWLYRTGYDFKRLFTLSGFYDRNREEFYGAIQNVRLNNMDMTGWLEYFTKGLALQLRDVHRQGAWAVGRSALKKEYALSDRQMDALDYVFEHGRLTIGQYQKTHRAAARRTLQRDLKSLTAKNLLRAKGATNRLEYVFGSGVRL